MEKSQRETQQLAVISHFAVKGSRSLKSISTGEVSKPITILIVSATRHIHLGSVPSHWRELLLYEDNEIVFVQQDQPILDEIDGILEEIGLEIYKQAGKAYPGYRNE